MSENSKSPIRIILAIVVVFVILAGLYLFLFTEEPKAPTEENSPTVTLVQDTNLTESEDSQPTENTDETQMPATDLEGWVTQEGDGFEFQHPNYYIRDNGDHYIVAYEPRVGQEFAAIAIFKPVEMADAQKTMQDKVNAMVAGEAATVIADPKEVSIDGFKKAYLAEYNVTSGPTTGPNKYYLLQSPYTDEWVSIEYAVADNSEKIRESFRFVE